MKSFFSLLVSGMLMAGPALSATLASSAATPYPNTSAMGGGNPPAEDWYRQCQAVATAAPPGADLPPASAVAALATCNAEELYYDTKNLAGASRAEWQAVRYCAVARNDNAVLMMLYANGLGVVKNPRLALKSACSLAAAPAEMRIRVEHLNQLASSVRAESFDLCDDITSGAMQGHCTAIAARQKGGARNKQLGSLTKGWPAPAQAALKDAQQALEVFADNRARNETDLSGTARAAMAIAAESAELDLFAQDLQKFEQGKTPRFSAAELAAFDKKLNQVYRDVMTASDDSRYGTVQKNDIKLTQRSWLKYRDALVRFGAVRYPAVAPDSWKALLTSRRTAQLQEFLPQ